MRRFLIITPGRWGWFYAVTHSHSGGGAGGIMGGAWVLLGMIFFFLIGVVFFLLAIKFDSERYRLVKSWL